MQKHTGDDSVMMLISIDEQSTCSNLCTACTFEIVRVQQVMLRETMDSQLLHRMYIRFKSAGFLEKTQLLLKLLLTKRTVGDIQTPPPFHDKPVYLLNYRGSSINIHKVRSNKVVYCIAISVLQIIVRLFTCTVFSSIIGSPN